MLHPENCCQWRFRRFCRRETSYSRAIQYAVLYNAIKFCVHVVSWDMACDPKSVGQTGFAGGENTAWVSKFMIWEG